MGNENRFGGVQLANENQLLSTLTRLEGRSSLEALLGVSVTGIHNPGD